MANEDKTTRAGGCSVLQILAVKDTLNVISGKWNMPIIATLRYGRMRFNEIQRSIPKITPRMPSKELKELELNGIIERNLSPAARNVVEYELTESGRKLANVAEAMIEWGLEHRRNILTNLRE